MTETPDHDRAMGAALRARRESLGWSRPALADRLALFGLVNTSGGPLAPQRVEQVENGTKPLRVVELLTFAAALDMSPDVVLFPDGSDGVAVTATFDVGSTAGRAWVAGRKPLPNALVLHPDDAGEEPPRVLGSWPVEAERDGASFADRVDRWRSTRPAWERRARQLGGVPAVMRWTDELVEAAALTVSRTAQVEADRALAVAIDGLSAAIQEVMRAAAITSRPDVESAVRRASEEMADRWRQYAERHTEDEA